MVLMYHLKLSVWREPFSDFSLHYYGVNLLRFFGGIVLGNDKCMASRFLQPYPNCIWVIVAVNTLRPRQNGRHFTDDIFKGIFLNEVVWILLKISRGIFPKVPINNVPSLVQIMAWRRTGDKPLSEPVMVSLLMHFSVTRPQWVKAAAAVTVHLL